MAWKGRFLVIGFTTGEIPRLPLNIALLKGCSIVGVFYRASLQHEADRHRQNMAELMAWFGGGRIKPHVSATYRLEQAAQALRAVAQRKVKGKIALVTDLAHRA